MDVRKEDFPVVVQAFETSGNSDVFIAEQVVNSQVDIDNFTSRYTGKLIKARKLTDVETRRQDQHTGNNSSSTTHTRRSNKTGTYILVVILLILTALVIVGFTTGWIQRTFNINMTVFPLLNFLRV